MTVLEKLLKERQKRTAAKIRRLLAGGADPGEPEIVRLQDRLKRDTDALKGIKDRHEGAQRLVRTKNGE